jgi:hypothetical protein
MKHDDKLLYNDNNIYVCAVVDIGGNMYFVGAPGGGVSMGSVA